MSNPSNPSITNLVIYSVIAVPISALVGRVHEIVRPAKTNSVSVAVIGGVGMAAINAYLFELKTVQEFSAAVGGVSLIFATVLG